MANANDPLIPLYVRYLRSRSRLAVAGDYGPLRLAAHLFAVASQLVEDGHSLEELPFVRHARSERDLESALSGLPDRPSAAELYALLKDGLSLAESLCGDRKDVDYSETTVIDEIEHEGRPLLGGRVVAWVRRPRLYRELRERELEEARVRKVSLPPRKAEHPDKDLDRLFLYWKRGNEFPGICRAEPEDHTGPLLREAGLRLGQGEPFRVALCPLVGESRPCFELTEDRRGFRTSTTCPIHEPEGASLRGQIQEILEVAVRQRIHLLVFPELTVDLQTREWLADRLSRSASSFPHGVVAGSFHFEKDGIDRPYNESRLLDEKGWLLLEHQKAGRFRLTVPQLKAAHKSGHFPEVTAQLLETLEPSLEIEERIEPGTRLSLLETSVAQVAVLICADAIDVRNRRRMRDAVTSLRPDFVLLPSMSYDTEPFRRFGEDLEELGIGLFFVNAHCACGPGGTLASVRLAQYEAPGGHPTRVRWRRDHPPERWNRKPAEGESEWSPLDPHDLPDRPEDHTPFSRLVDSAGESVGLVVDLGVYWRG